MASVEIRGLDEFVRGLSEFESSQLPFAMAKTLTDIAWIGKTNTVNEMQGVFDRPTTYTLNSLQVEKATKQKLTSKVFVKSMGVKPHYLIPQVTGGNRRFKSFEAALLGRGIMPSGYYVVPASFAEFDAFGNMKRSQIKEIFNLFGAKYFSIKPGSTSSLKPGIYERFGGTRALPIVLFIRNTTYREKLDMQKIADKTYDENFNELFNENFENAVNSSWT